MAPTDARGSRPDRGESPANWSRPAGHRLGPLRRRPTHRQRRRRRGAAVRRHRVIPRLAGTATEIEQVLRALDGRFIPAGPSGSPLRGLVNVLPTGRNFYRGSQGGAVPAGVGSRCGTGRFAAGALPR
ncbi:cobaltochelatase subunit CobN [Mycobacterium tuberculosis]